MRHLIQLSLLTLLLASPALAQDSPLHAGPMQGYVAERSVALWVQTKRPATVQYRYFPVDAPGKAILTKATRTQPEVDHCLTTVIDGLTPGVRYGYELYLDGKNTARPYALGFETRPLWRWRTAPPTVTLLAGSCAYFSEPEVDRPGRSYGGQWEIFENMAKVKADGMLWLGDNVYFREVDWTTREGLAARYRHDRATPQLQALLAAMPHYAIWDDHDFGPNDSDSTYPLKDEALKLFKRYWPAVHYGMPKTKGVFQQFPIADAEVFMLDDRYHRSPNSLPIGPDKRMVGKGQMKWIKHALAASRATFKIVAIGSQVLNKVTPYEAWQPMFPQEQKELLDWIVSQKIEGVVFLSGDRHHTELLVEKPSGGYPLYDFTTSPLTSGAHRLREDHVEYNNPLRVPGTLVGERNFAVIKLTGPAKDRRLILETRRVDGTRIWRQEIPRSKLGWPRKGKGKLW